MPERALKTLLRSRTEIIKSALVSLKSLPRREYNHMKRLIQDGTERDVVFMQGLTTGLQLAVLDKGNVQILVRLLQKGVDREDGGKDRLLDSSDLSLIEEILRKKFSIGASKRITLMLGRSDGVFLTGLIDMLKKFYRLS
jgi:hypothetical protein